jgi:uncharacterized MAPEG superfamily protein
MLRPQTPTQTNDDDDKETLMEALTTDLRMLVYTGVLPFLILPVILAGRTVTPGGAKWGLGNRDQPMKFPGWAERAGRAHANLVENLAPFAILVLVAHLSGQANDVTAMAARAFFWLRAAHALVYIAGIAGLRTLIFIASIAAEIVIMVQILA